MPVTIMFHTSDAALAVDGRQEIARILGALGERIATADWYVGAKQRPVASGMVYDINDQVIGTWFTSIDAKKSA